MGAMTTLKIHELLETFRHIIEIFIQAPEHLEECIYCFHFLFDAITETTMTPQRYKLILIQFMELTLTHYFEKKNAFSRDLLHVTLDFIQNLIGSVNPYFSLNEGIFVAFSFLSSIEKNWDRLSFIDCSAFEDHPVYRLMTGKELKAEDNVKNTQTRLYNSMKETSSDLFEVLSIFIKSLFEGVHTPPPKNADLMHTRIDLKKLMDSGDGVKAAQLWRELNQKGQLDGCNDHWNLFFMATKADYGSRRTLAEMCCLIPLKEEEIEAWTRHAPALITHLSPRTLVKKLLRTFIALKRTVPSPLIPLFVNLHEPKELCEPEIIQSFSGDAWKEFYPELFERYFRAGNFISLGYLWEGWMKYRGCGADPDEEGITERLIKRSLAGDLGISNSILNRLICWVYRERKTKVYGNLSFLFLPYGLNSQVFNAWEQLIDDENAEVIGWKDVNENNRIRINLLIDEQGCSALRLLNISLKREWIQIQTCQNIIAAINSNSKLVGTFLDDLMKDAVDPVRQKQAQDMLDNLVELCVAVKENVPYDVLIFVNRMFCDRADPIGTGWVYHRFMKLLTQLIYDVAKTIPTVNAIDEAVFIISKHFVRQYAQYASVYSLFQMFKVAINNVSALTVTRNRLTNWSQEPSAPDVVLRTQMIWKAMGGTQNLYIEKDQLAIAPSHP